MIREAMEKILDKDIDLEKKLKYFIRAICNVIDQKFIIDELKKSDTQEATMLIKSLNADRKLQKLSLIIYPCSKILKFEDYVTEQLKTMLEKALSDKSEKNLEKWLFKRYFDFFSAEKGYDLEAPDSMFVLIKTILTLQNVPRGQAMDIAFDLVEKRKILEEFKNRQKQNT